MVGDASALVEYLLGTEAGTAIGQFVTDPETDLHVPALCDVEVASALRRAMLSGLLSEDRAIDAVADHLALPLTRHGHQVLLPRMLELRANVSAYDAAYVALAERLGASLLTGDRRLARAVSSELGLPVLP